MADNDVQVSIGAKTDDFDANVRQSADVMAQSQQAIVAAANLARESFQNLGTAAAKWADITKQSATDASGALRSVGVDYRAVIEAATGLGQANKSAADSAAFFEDMMGVTAQRAQALREALTTVDGQFNAIGADARRAGADTSAGLNSISGSARTASNAMAGFFTLNRAGRMELQAAAINFAQGVASGISPLRMLQTEGAQVFGALIQGGALTASTLIGIGGVIAAVTAGFVGFGIAVSEGADQSRRFNAALAVTANAAGETASAMAGIRAEALKTGDISAATAQAIATDMVNTGKISSEVIGRLVSLTADYAKATNETASEAGASLTKAFEDPARAMKALDEAFNLLSDAERQHIRDLIDQGDRTQAQIALSDALGNRIHNLADEDLGYLGQALKSVGNAWDVFWNKAQGIGRTESIAERLADVRAQIAALKQEKEDFEKGTSGLAIPFGRQGELSGLLDEEGRLQTQQNAEAAAAAMQAQSARVQELSKSMGDAARASDSFAQKQHDLQNQITASENAAKLIRQEIDSLGEASSGPDLKRLGELNAALKNTETVGNNAAGALTAMRTPLQQAQDLLKISQQVAAAPREQQAPLRAKLLTQDELSHSANPRDREEADARAELAYEKALADQRTEITRNSLQEKLTAIDAEVAGEQQGSQRRIDLLKQEADLVRSAYGEQSKEYQQVQVKIAEAQRQADQQRLQEKLASLDVEAAQTRSGSAERIAILKQETALVKQQYGEQSQEYQNALSKQRQAELQHQHELTQIKMDGVDARQQLDLLALDDQRGAYDLDVQLGRLTNSQKVALLRQYEGQRYQIELQAQQQRIQLALQDPTQSPQQLQKLYSQLEVLDRQHQNRINQIDRQAVTNTKTQWQGIVAPFNNAISGITQGILQGTQTWQQAISNAGISAFASLIDAGEKWLANYLLNLIIGETAQQASADTQITTNAATAASGAYSSAASIPYVGWIIAPAAAAMALGAVLAFKGGLAVGTPNVPQDMATTVHKGEIVVPRTFSDAIRSGDMTLGGPNGAGGSGGDFHMHGNIVVQNSAGSPLTERELMRKLKRGWRDNPDLRPV